MRTRRPMRWNHKHFLLAALLAGCWSRPAHAFRTGEDLPELRRAAAPVNWSSQSVTYAPNTALPPGVAAADMARVAAQAASAWTDPACSNLVLLGRGSTAAPATAGDHVNTIQWLFSGWEERGFPPDSPGATDVSYAKDAAGQWHIVEADIYLNGTRKTWVVSGKVTDGQWDLLSTLTHEFGHLGGLLHPCELEGTNGAPRCDGEEPMAGTTMYPTYHEGEGSLEPDDVDGICYLYPVPECHPTCGDGSTCTRDGCVPLCGGAVCVDGETCRGDKCVPSQAAECGGLLPPCASPCEKDADCNIGQRCETGSCRPSVSGLGDGCEDATSCTSGACSDTGGCTRRCQTNADCRLGLSCALSDRESGVKMCGPASGPQGATCRSADDCLGGECVDGYAGTALCTRRCEPPPSNAACPAGWDCSVVEGKSVCVPVAPQAGCACRAAGASTDSLPAMAILSALALIPIVRRKRRT